MGRSWSKSKAEKSKAEKSRSSRLRSLPWASLVQVGFVLGRRVEALSDKDRARLGGLLRQSRGWPARLGGKERAELRRLLGKLDVKRMGRELMLLRAAGRRRKRR